MVTLTVKCPKCNNKVTIKVNSEDQNIITCPQCGTKGKYTLPKQKPEVMAEKGNTIEVENLSKHFKNFKAVDSISFSVKKGEVFGFLGPNGAGKTTTIKMMTTILRPKNGSVKICGYDLKTDPIKAKQCIGFMPDVPGFYGEMTGENILHFYAEFYRIPKEARKKKIDDLLKMMQLTEFKKKKVKTYSRGMKPKPGFSTALLNDPQVLILDEPTIGLDPTTIHFFRKLFTQLNAEGKTIFLSSHILSEVQLVCDRVGIINRGKIIAVDTIDNLSELISAKKSRKVIVKADKVTTKVIHAIQQIPGVLSVDVNKGMNRLDIQLKSGKDLIPRINEILVKHGIPVRGLETKEADLEDIFLSLVGESNEN